MSRRTPQAEEPAEPQRVRCAIYTRKSTSEGLDSDFNTLDAQREASEYYIQAMRYQGWEVLPERYDDGGYSGGNVERPALKKLLDDVEAGKIDCVVVYKVDRLSRSLLDFAKLLALFDEHEVGFVSTTQQFNTQDAMGRLTLNILLSFAQFEREMIADRTRDKMGAARKRGKWLGSRPPLGYRGDRDEMRLVVIPEEAEKVRTIFGLYLRLGTAADVARQINALGWERKQVTIRSGEKRGGGEWGAQDVHTVLRNPTYIGLVRYQRQVYEGEHEGIVDPVLYEQVQQTMSAKACGRGTRRGRNPEYLLQGLLWCGMCGARMHSASGRGRNNEEYRYYSCKNRSRRAKTPCDHPRLVATEVEEVVIERMRELCSDAEMRRQIAERMGRLEPTMGSAIQQERAKIDTRRGELRAQADTLLRTVGPGGGKLVAERIGKLELELEELDTQAAVLDGQTRALQRAVELVFHTMRILEMFDQAWAAFNPEERQDLVKVLVERVEVNEPAGQIEIRFHDLGGPFGEVPPEASEDDPEEVAVDRTVQEGSPGAEAVEASP